MAKGKGSTKAAGIARKAAKTRQELAALERSAVKAVAPAGPTRLADQLRVGAGVRLADIDPRSTPGFAGSKEEGAAALSVGAVRLSDLQERLFAASKGGDTRSVLLVVQGMDTAGKGGIMRHVVGSVDPQGVHITSFKAPTEEERKHDFLWRIRNALPAAGMIGVFDRSHYEDVLIARVHEIVPADQIEQRYDQINAFEREVADAGTTMVKVMLHVSAAEQKERLAERLERPDKHWKYNPHDVDERLRWHDYQQAYEIALERCSTDAAPWFVVPADRKWYARWAVQQLLLDALSELDPQWPAADYDIEAEKVRLATA
jgi:PPK2 family polyphosphate:nucleotide phosphotransferase